MAYFAIDALAISIHAPRTGSDDFLVIFRVACCISIHAPRTGSDSAHFPSRWGLFRFQSTLPARGATWKPLPIGARLRYFNPRSPHGERRPDKEGQERKQQFQSTLPARGATHRFAAPPAYRRYFNPRSPHGERPNGRYPTFAVWDFNPRSPHGERRQSPV